MAATKTGGTTKGNNRGGSGSIKIIKVGQQKVDLKPVIKATKLGKPHADLKRDGRHVAHKPTTNNGKMKYSHMDIATKDKRDGASVTRTIALRGGH